VQLPKQMLKAIPKDYFDGARGTLKLLWEEEWRALGITQVRVRRDSVAEYRG
jgi:cyclin-dependent kinase regulatory subunit CKS1